MDLRIHFALNCASRSCPPIRVYDAERLDVQLDLAAQNFVASEVTVAAGQIALSRIFQWYQVDFGGRPGIRDFLVRHVPDDDSHSPLRAILQNSTTAVKFVYRPYDWSINKV
jgi:hypothetical protein